MSPWASFWQVRHRALLPISLIVLAALAILLRIPSIAEPIGIDQSLWASAVRGMARGQLLYRDVWEQRPPGIYLTYLAAFSLFGWTTAAVAWLDVVASAVTTVVLFALGRALAGRTTAALTAAIYALLTMPAWLYRYGGFIERSVCETFIVICAGAAALCAVAFQKRSSVAMAFGIGLWTGAAAVFKPNAALYLPALLAWGLAAGPLAGRGATGRWMRPLAAAGMGFLVFPVLATLWLWRLDLLPEAKTAVIDFNRWYVAAGFEPAAFALAFSKEVWLRMKTDPLWLAGGVATLIVVWDLVRTRRLPLLPALAVFWGGAAALVIAVNGARLFNTYFIQALAPLALLVGWWLTDGCSSSRLRQALGVTTVILMGTLLVQRHYVDKVFGMVVQDTRVLLGHVDQVTNLERFGSYATGRGYSARANEELAVYVRAHTLPDDQVFLFGINGAGVYFLADRLSAHRFLRVNFFVPDGFPDPQFTLRAVVEDLRARPPAYLIFEQLHSETEMARAVDALQEHPLIRSLLEHYTSDGRIEDFTLYRRR